MWNFDDLSDDPKLILQLLINNLIYIIMWCRFLFWLTTLCIYFLYVWNIDDPLHYNQWKSTVLKQKSCCYLDNMKKKREKWKSTEMTCEWNLSWAYMRSSICVTSCCLCTGFRNRVYIHTCPERRIKHIYACAALCFNQGRRVLNPIWSCCSCLWPNITPSRCDTLIRLAWAQKCYYQSCWKHPT